MSRLYISATHKSSGKTTLSIGLCRNFAQLRYRVRPFKKGPDYIDPLWLGQAAGRPCLNLDYNTMGLGEIRETFARAMGEADLGLIEGMWASSTPWISRAATATRRWPSCSRRPGRAGRCRACRVARTLDPGLSGLRSRPQYCRVILNKVGGSAMKPICAGSSNTTRICGCWAPSIASSSCASSSAIWA